MQKVYITYRTPEGAEFTDAMDSVESFRAGRGYADEIVDVSPPFEADFNADPVAIQD